MKVLVLGGTGSIGGAVVQRLQERSHQVLGLARSQQAANKLEVAGAHPVVGDIKNPQMWIGTCDQVDAVVHAAASWDEEMGACDKRVVDAVLPRLSKSDRQKAFIYTGGCWLYGETGDTVATEETPPDELESFNWTLPSIHNVLTATQIRGMVIHPAMVYEKRGGVFEHIYKDAENLGFVRVVKSEHTRWPLVHRLDLAELYALMLEQGMQGDVYNGATNEGITSGEITRAIARQYDIHEPPKVMNVAEARAAIGDYAEGYALDQQMSSKKAREKLGWQPEFADPLAAIA